MTDSKVPSDQMAPGKTKSEAAVARFCDGCNCSQAVMTAFAERYAIDDSLAMRIAAGLGGGVGRMGDV
ncbi:MAG: C-GCAxxG-C-C family (seleno)protein, partial [Candidatus Thiodiazotropha sp.]